MRSAATASSTKVRRKGGCPGGGTAAASKAVAHATRISGSAAGPHHLRFHLSLAPTTHSCYLPGRAGRVYKRQMLQREHTALASQRQHSSQAWHSCPVPTPLCLLALPPAGPEGIAKRDHMGFPHPSPEDQQLAYDRLLAFFDQHLKH